MAWKLRKDKLADATESEESTQQTGDTPVQNSSADDILEFKPSLISDTSRTEEDILTEKVELADDLVFAVPAFLDDEPHLEESSIPPISPSVTATDGAPEPTAPPIKPVAKRPSKKAIAARVQSTDVAPETQLATISHTEPIIPITNEPTVHTEWKRDDIAPGLIEELGESEIPRVAPFIVDTRPPTVSEPRLPESRSITLRVGNLSAKFLIIKDLTTIGRPDSSIQNYPDIEIELDDGVSRRHAQIERILDNYTLTDLGSTNGTILNGEMLQANVPSSLMPGDHVRIGERTEIIFE